MLLTNMDSFARTHTSTPCGLPNGVCFYDTNIAKFYIYHDLLRNNYLYILIGISYLNKKEKCYPLITLYLSPDTLYISSSVRKYDMPSKIDSYSYWSNALISG